MKTRQMKQTIKLTRMCLVIGIAAVTGAAATPQSAAQTGDAPATAARQEWERLRAQTGLIEDISATALVAIPFGTVTNLTYHYFSSRQLGFDLLP